MKAILFHSTTSGNMDARLENGVVIKAKTGETDVEFSNRVANTIEEDYMEEKAEIIIVNTAKLKKRGVKALTDARPSSEGVETEIIDEILAARAAAGVKAAQKAIEDTDKPETKKAAKKAPKKPKAKKEPKPKREPARKHTEAELAAIVAEAKKNIGRECTFTPFRSETPITGRIRSIMQDKRVMKAYYTVFPDPDSNKFHHTSVEKVTNIITGDVVPHVRKNALTEEQKAEREAAKAAKAAEKKAAREAKAAERAAAKEAKAAEREAAKAAKAEERRIAREKKAADKAAAKEAARVAKQNAKAAEILNEEE